MKEWIFPILITTIASLLIREFLPKGEKSPLYPAIKFLLSLVLTLSVLSPFLSLSQKNIDTDAPLFSDSLFYEGDEKERLLTTCKQDMESAVRSAFPEEEILLELKSGDDCIPYGIHFVCKSEESGKKIATFLEKNFSLVTTYDIEGGAV